jgi:hypothetical protein
MAKINSPKIADPYLGQMYGNILDQYDNPAYNIRLYMKSEGDSAATGTSSSTQTGTQSDPAAGSAARSDQPSDVTKETKTIAGKKIVILAQTGVTGVQIDDVEIQSGNQKDTATKALTGSFTIVQPGGANFLDQIQWTRKYLGAPDAEIKTNDFYMYLDINFLGYDSPVRDGPFDDHEDGGEMLQITDTITYKIKVTSIAVSLDNTGSRYEIEFAIADTIGFADDIYKIKQSISMQGGTITELLKSFETQYNNLLTSSANLFDKADQIEFNLDALLKNYDAKTPTAVKTTTTGAKPQKLYIKDENIPSPDKDQNVELTTVPIFDGEIKSAEEQRQENDGASSRGPTSVQPGIILTAREGSSIYTILAQVLSMNKEFQSYVSRMKSLDDPSNNEVDNNQTFVAWFDVHCEIQTIGWDKKRNKYAKKYIYTPYLIEDVRSDVALTTKELEFLNETVEIGKDGALGNRPVVAIATKRLQDLYNAGALHKSYFYIFTGLNDQILNLDIKYDQGLTLLMPPKGGYAGDYSVLNKSALVNSLPERADPTGDDKNNAANDTKNRESLVDLFNKLKGFADDIKTVANAIGRSPEELAGILKDSTGKATQRLAQSLDSATVETLTKKLGSSDSSDAKDTPTTNTEITVTNFGPYAPEVSGFLYSADFVQPGGNLTTEEIQAAGLITSNVPAVTPGATATVAAKPSPLSGITSDGPASVMMGYAYRARESSGFLLNVELTLRGDPYWLTQKNSGKFEYGKPTPDRTTYPSNGKKNYFLLTIGSPRAYDYDVNNEDNNTGYWSENSISGMFSGLYYPTIWKNRFSAGIFTTEITAFKEIAVPLNYIRRVLPNEKPPAWDEILKDQDVEKILGEIGSNNRRLFGDGDTGGDGDGPSTYTPVTGGKGDWANDKPFLDEIDRLARKYDIDANDLLGVMHSESGIDPSKVGTAEGGTRYVGLIQFGPDAAKIVGKTQEEILRMSRAEQMQLVEKWFDYWKLPKGASPGQLYTSVYLPAYAKESPDFVLARENNNNPRGVPDGAYSQNRRFDQKPQDGQITIREVGQEVANKRREIGL